MEWIVGGIIWLAVAFLAFMYTETIKALWGLRKRNE